MQILNNFSQLDPRKITFSMTVNFPAGRPAVRVQSPMFARKRHVADVRVKSCMNRGGKRKRCRPRSAMA